MTEKMHVVTTLDSIMIQNTAIGLLRIAFHSVILPMQCGALTQSRYVVLCLAVRLRP